MIHVRPFHTSRCDPWVVLDEKAAWSPEFQKVIMNWRKNSGSDNVHWEWECGTS